MVKRLAVISSIAALSVTFVAAFGAVGTVRTSSQSQVQHLISTSVSRPLIGQKSSVSLKWSPPFPNAMIPAGDSRTRNEFILSASGASETFDATQTTAGWAWTAVQNKIGRPFNYCYGVSGQTSLGLLDRLNVASNATTGNPANSLTGTAPDSNYNSGSSSQYSLIGHPANVVWLTIGINDNAAASGYFTKPLLSMQTIGQVLDKLYPKVVFLCNEYPRGQASIWYESRTVTSNSCTAINTTGFVDGSTATLADGLTSANITGVYRGDTGAPLTKVASAPGAGQYSVTSGGVYTFGDTFTPALLNYVYTANNAYGSQPYQQTLHDWLSSSAAKFTEISSNGFNSVGYSYGVSGALFNRPHVHLVDTYGAMQNPQSPGTPLLYTLQDGLHPSGYGAQLIAYNKFAPTFNSVWPNLPRVTRSPAANNMKWCTSNGSINPLTGSVGGSGLGVSMTPITPGKLKVTIGPNVSGWDDGAGHITGTNITAGTVNYTTGAISVTVNSVATNAPAGAIGYAFLDYDNAIVDNPLFDTSTQGTNSFTGGTSGTVPKPWTTSVSNFGGCTATVTATTIFDPDDGVTYPCLKYVFGPGTAPLAASPTFSLSNPSVNTTANPQLTAGMTYRSSIKVRIEPGADGNLYGLTGVGTSFTITSSAGVTKPGGSSATVFASQTFPGASNPKQPLTNLNLNGQGFLQYEAASASLNTANFSSTTANANGVIGFYGGAPVSATVYFYRAAFKPVATSSMEY